MSCPIVRSRDREIRTKWTLAFPTSDGSAFLYKAATVMVLQIQIKTRSQQTASCIQHLSLFEPPQTAAVVRNGKLKGAIPWPVELV